MGNLQNLWSQSVSRRKAVRQMASFLAGSPLLLGQQDPFRDHSRIPGLSELLSAFDFEAVAYARLPRAAYDYTAYGADSEFTLRRNREAFDWVHLNPGKAAKPGAIRTATEILGTKMDFPIMVSPSSGHGALHADGEIATHKGTTAAANTTMIVSNASSFPFEKVAAAATGPVWFQLYPRQNIDDDREILERVQASGCKGVVVTIDQQISTAPYERTQHDRNISGRGGARRPPPRGPYGLTDTRLWYEWKFFDQIRPFIKVPMLAKGILTGDDAKKCLDHGCDGVYVSNHGGRSLDYGPSTLEVLPEIVDAIRGRAPILFDSGIRRGADILKALALGANAVCLGRVPRWGLGAYGAEGVQRVVEIMQAELVQAMAHAGRTTLDAIDRTVVRTDFP